MTSKRGVRTPKLNALTTSLRDGGVSPAYISRLLAELDDHYADLEQEERTNGREPAAAAVEALRRLGRQDTEGHEEITATRRFGSRRAGRSRLARARPEAPVVRH